MSTDKLERARELFEAALGCPAEQRDALLREQCGDDADLRAEVEVLLAHAERVPPEFLKPLSTPPGGDDDPDVPDPYLGMTIGGCRVERKLAPGGMGTVYLARQDRPAREVALKLIRPGLMSRSAIRRFEREAEFLARLRHPHVAQVYAAGTHLAATPAGSVQVPYIVMEYVEEPAALTAFADRQQLGTRARVELFCQVCDAVHHAHQKGLIHRDLKPGNLLVDAGGQVKVIDFGIARSTDADVAVTTAATDVGQLLGTLQYMSPEQCAGDPRELDIRSDIYALGVVLYELLCGKLPYDVSRTTVFAAARIVREEPPARPSTVDRTLRGDLELVVLKALEKDRDRRYQSAAELADDLRRYLRGEPASAKKPTLWTRAARWSAGHPVWITASMCVLIVVTSVVFTFGAVFWLRLRPAEIRINETEDTARLFSVTGHELHAWKVPPPAEIHSAEVVSRPPEFGGGNLVLLGFVDTGDGRYGDGLCAFDTAGSLDEPIWQAFPKPEDVPPGSRPHDYASYGFSARILLVDDVFPEHPGKEVVVAHVFGYFSQCCVRVYGLDGSILYEVWQDGGVEHAYWMAGCGLLVLAASEADMFVPALAPPAGLCIARVVFALRPELGLREKFVNPKLEQAPQSLLWYRYVHGPAAVFPCLAVGGIMVPGARYSRDEYAHLGIRLTAEGIGEAVVWWIIDAEGNEVPNTRDAGDGYKLNRDRLPPLDPADPNAVHLSDKPPVSE
ncbi:MAG TPA: serine/threonine-protein kinase [Phycisphaerae bacterium]|nr:serine/threonine-protein kinase [Phycisphaerae bacterium]HNU46247.1 serine/threonine-protein kinase [Phycisphaerae bacterium]